MDDSVPENDPGKAQGDTGGAGRRLGLAGFLLELLFPVALSATALLMAAGHIPVWNLRGPLGLGVLGVLLVAMSLLVSVKVDSWTLSRRKARGKSQLLNRASARARFAKITLAGIVIPLGALAAATMVELPNHQTLMAAAVQLGHRSPVASRAEQLGGAVMRAANPAAKAQGMLALQSMGSEDAMAQLFRILAEDKAVLHDGVSSLALSKALASFGVQAKPLLMQRLAAATPEQRRAAAGPPADLFDRYFSAAFGALDSELAGGGPEQAPESSEPPRLQAAKAELVQALHPLERDTVAPQAGADLPGFVMSTFLRMSLTQDTELLALARQTAADAGCSAALRGQALLLVAKLGGQDDLDSLYGCLDGHDPQVEARAMEAIAILEAKLAAARARS
jgi:hypothetical protein